MRPRRLVAVADARRLVSAVRTGHARRAGSRRYHLSGVMPGSAPPTGGITVSVGWIGLTLKSPLPISASVTCFRRRSRHLRRASCSLRNIATDASTGGAPTQGRVAEAGHAAALVRLKRHGLPRVDRQGEVGRRRSLGDHRRRVLTRSRRVAPRRRRRRRRPVPSR